MYMFQGISLVTQNYINPAIDTIKKKGIVSERLSYLLGYPKSILFNSIAWFGHHERHFTRFL